MKRFLFCLFAVGFLVSSAYADPINLSSWTAYTYNLGGQTAGNWVLSDSNETVTQTINADPSMYLNNLSQTSYQMDGSWKVITGSDDDFMGFVFGYQDSSHFYVMDWKKGNQSYAGYAYEGFTIKRISANSVADLTLNDFWASAGTANSTILATSFSSTSGWVANTTYDFHLDFAPGSFDIEVFQGGTTTSLWDVSVTDSTYEYGQFGFYNFSQEQVQYSGFEQTGGVIVDAPVPEPSTIILLGGGLMGLVWYGRKRKQA